MATLDSTANFNPLASLYTSHSACRLWPYKHKLLIQPGYYKVEHSLSLQGTKVRCFEIDEKLVRVNQHCAY